MFPLGSIVIRRSLLAEIASRSVPLIKACIRHAKQNASSFKVKYIRAHTKSHLRLLRRMCAYRSRYGWFVAIATISVLGVGMYWANYYTVAPNENVRQRSNWVTEIMATSVDAILTNVTRKIDELTSSITDFSYEYAMSDGTNTTSISDELALASESEITDTPSEGIMTWDNDEYDFETGVHDLTTELILNGLKMNEQFSAWRTAHSETLQFIRTITPSIRKYQRSQLTIMLFTSFSVSFLIYFLYSKLIRVRF